MASGHSLSRVTRVLRIVFFVLIVAAVFFPIHCMIVSSLESYRGYTSYWDYAKWTPLPRKLTWLNYIALTQGQWALGFRNSVIISLANTAFCLLVAFPATYVYTRTRFRFDRWFFFWVMLNRVVPPGAFIVPCFITYVAIGLYDTLPGVILAHSVFNLPLAVWLLSGFMRDIPTTVDEAAFVDGYSVWGFWRRVFLPLMMPAIGVTAFFLWMFSWTEVILANAVTLFRAYPMTVNLLAFSGAQAAAAGVLSMIPGVVILYFARRYIARGFLLGGRLGGV